MKQNQNRKRQNNQFEIDRSYHEKKNDLVHCPFNRNHLVKQSRLKTHKKNCPDRIAKGLVQCPYNPSHYLSVKELEKHKRSCPDRVIIDPELGKLMAQKIKERNEGIKNNPKIEPKKNQNINVENKNEQENIIKNSNESKDIKEIKQSKEEEEKINEKKSIGEKSKEEDLKEEKIDNKKIIAEEKGKEILGLDVAKNMKKEKKKTKKGTKKKSRPIEKLFDLENFSNKDIFDLMNDNDNGVMEYSTTSVDGENDKMENIYDDEMSDEEEDEDYINIEVEDEE